MSQSHTPTSCPSSPHLSFRIHTHIHPSQSHFNAVLQELLASGDSLAEIGGGDSDSAEGRLVYTHNHQTRHVASDWSLYSDDPDTRTGKKEKSGSKSKKDKGQKSKAAAARAVVAASAAAVAVRSDRGVAAPSGCDFLQLVLSSSLNAGGAVSASAAGAKGGGKRSERKIEPVSCIESKVRRVLYSAV